MDPSRDVFDRAYHAQPVQELAPAAVELAPRAVLADAVALRGCVLTPDGPLADGYVVVDGGIIAAVTGKRPEGVRVHDTAGVILPGMIDLHGHPEFNVFAAWEPPRRFANRYQWRASDLYRTLIREPQNLLLTTLPAHTQLRYAEIRALVGGVTAIQGASGRDQRAGRGAGPQRRQVRSSAAGGPAPMIDLP